MPCTNIIEKGRMPGGPIPGGDCSTTVLGSRHVRVSTQKLNWLYKGISFRRKPLLGACAIKGRV